MKTDPIAVADKVWAFFDRFPIQKYDKGQIIVFAGDAPGGVFFLTSGSVGQYDISARGDKIIVNVFKPEAFFPMSWAYQQNTNTFFYEALNDVEVRRAPVDETLKFMEANPDVLRDLLMRVYRGMEGVLQRMVQLMGGSARSRLVFEPVVSTRRFGKHRRDGSYHLAINERDLASRTGLTRETINREIRKLKAEGQLQVD
jgi:CRP/FNR family transcriptional regulator